MPYQEDGSVLQSGLQRFSADHHHERIYYPVLGMVLNVYCSDDYRNTSAIPKADLKGSQCEARVLVLNDGKDGYWIIPNAVITPRGSSGIDNFYEELPRAAAKHVDGETLEKHGYNTDYFKLDGDLCVVGFLGGNIEQPFIMNWWPHTANVADPSSSDVSERGFLAQGRRLVRRFQGTKLAITSAGSVFLDTSEANSELLLGQTKPGGGIPRSAKEEGGDLEISVKKERQLSVRFDPPVHQPDAEPDLLQPNPPIGTNVRSDEASKLLMNAQSILARAGRAIQIAGDNDGSGSDDTVFLGENPTSHLVLGEEFQSTFNALVTVVNQLVNAFNSHTHISASSGSPTSGPTPTGLSTASNMPDTDLSKVVQTE